MNSALIILDMQNHAFTATPKPFQAAEVIQRINALSEKARASNVTVVWLQYENPQFLPYQSEGWRLHDSLNMLAEDLLIRKTQINAFIDSDLQRELVKRRISRLIVCGYASEFCIDSTIRYASTLGYQIVIIGDAHTTHDKSHLSAGKIREHHNLTLSAAANVELTDCQTALNDGLI